MGLLEQIQSEAEGGAAPLAAQPQASQPTSTSIPPAPEPLIKDVFKPAGMKAVKQPEPTQKRQTSQKTKPKAAWYKRPFTWTERIVVGLIVGVGVFFVERMTGQPVEILVSFHIPIRIAWFVLPVALSLAIILSVFLPKPPVLCCILYGYWGFSRRRLAWDRNTFCRGWIITGATGSGKTEAGINRLVHQVCTNEAGILRPEWEGSELQIAIDDERKKIEESLKTKQEKANETLETLQKLQTEKLEFEARNEVEAIRKGVTSGSASKDEEVELEGLVKSCQGNLDSINRQMNDKQKQIKEARDKNDLTTVVKLEEECEKLGAEVQKYSDTLNQTLIKINTLKEVFYGPIAKELNDKVVEIESCEQTCLQHNDDIEGAWFKFGIRMRGIEHIKFKRFPWAGICVDEKGTYYQTLEPTMKHYGRQHHLMMLQTRPTWAPAGWKPRATFNLISNEKIPSNTYASAISTTAQSVSGGDNDKAFFKFQAETNIGWAIELMRGIKRTQIAQGMSKDQTVVPNLKTIKDILTSQQRFDQFLIGVGAKAAKVEQTQAKGLKVAQEQQIESPTKPATLYSPKLTEAIEHFEGTGYWKQPKDQLGGVIGTVHNYLNFLTTDEVAEVFCGKNTVDITDMDKGIVFCLAMPQTLRIERRFICTLLKILFYNHVQSRDKPGYQETANMLILWQDEAQRFAIAQDGDVDTIRSKIATTVMATQSLKSMWEPLGGKDNAEVLLLNLRNRMIFTGADEDCSQANSKFIGERWKVKKSYSSGKGGTTTSVQHQYESEVHPAEIRALPKFTAYVCHADEGAKLMFLYPTAPNGLLPKWIGSAMGDFSQAMGRYRSTIAKKPWPMMRYQIALARLFNIAGNSANN